MGNAARAGQRYARETMIRRATALALVTLLTACGNTPSGIPAEPSAPRAPMPTTIASAAIEPSATASAAQAASAAPFPFADLVTSLSEPDGPFFSDNTISNET